MLDVLVNHTLFYFRQSALFPPIFISIVLGLLVIVRVGSLRPHSGFRLLLPTALLLLGRILLLIGRAIFCLNTIVVIVIIDLLLYHGGRILLRLVFLCCVLSCLLLTSCALFLRRFLFRFSLNATSLLYTIFVIIVIIIFMSIVLLLRYDI